MERWLWGNSSSAGELARLALVPVSLAYRGLVDARAVAYRAFARPKSLGVPTISVGNLAVGGAGKTPLSIWIAQRCLEMNKKPGIVLRGYGGDETLVHRKLVPEGIVVEDPKRVNGAQRAISEGADVIVLDDGFQRLGIKKDLELVLVSTESTLAPRWTLPAGPWREHRNALRRADIVIVTRKSMGAQRSRALVSDLESEVPGKPMAIAHLEIASFKGLVSEKRLSCSELKGKTVVTAAGIADPDAFAGQCRRMGAAVTSLRLKDHHRYSARDLERLDTESENADLLLITQKDAVKIRGRWPEGGKEPFVAELSVMWNSGEEMVLDALRATVRGHRSLDLT